MILAFEQNKYNLIKIYIIIIRLILSRATKSRREVSITRTTTLRNINACSDIDGWSANLKYFSQLFPRNTLNGILLVLHTMCTHNVRGKKKVATFIITATKYRQHDSNY
jgi:hypothetical protein